MAQLKMIFNAEKTALPEINLADGFEIRTVSDSELAEYNALRASVNFSTWDEERLAAFRNKVLDGGMLVIVEKATGNFVAAACAETTDMPELPHVGVLGWVMTNPEKQGFHLGRSVSVAAMHRLYRQGYRSFSLLTDDFRKAAVKTYLKLGWQPWLYLDEMEERWRKLADELGFDFDKLNCLPEKSTFPPMAE
ncbi:MAG: GNAT family N-acetyltransferase [Lentisphaeria bacterium]|nr:GNAT family N-acetyltransferase [Lentisphaerota bacterium]MBR2625738.1 GNAT family N-acetyltransferase [Lentisphaeria bacterium]